MKKLEDLTYKVAFRVMVVSGIAYVVLSILEIVLR